MPLDKTEMPRYRSHKEVEALKIIDATANEDGSADLFFGGKGQTHPPVNVKWPESARFGVPSPGAKVLFLDPTTGYFVQSKGGDASWLPAEVFENDYTLIE